LKIIVIFTSINQNEFHSIWQICAKKNKKAFSSITIGSNSIVFSLQDLSLYVFDGNNFYNRRERRWMFDKIYSCVSDVWNQYQHHKNDQAISVLLHSDSNKELDGLKNVLGNITDIVCHKYSSSLGNLWKSIIPPKKKCEPELMLNHFCSLWQKLNDSMSKNSDEKPDNTHHALKHCCEKSRRMIYEEAEACASTDFENPGLNKKLLELINSQLEKTRQNYNFFETEYDEFSIDYENICSIKNLLSDVKDLVSQIKESPQSIKNNSYICSEKFLHMWDLL